MCVKILAIFVKKVAGTGIYTGRNYVWVNERDIRDTRLKTTATAASHPHLATTPESKRKEGKRHHGVIYVVRKQR
jgi:hypothetical protein